MVSIRRRGERRHRLHPEVPTCTYVRCGDDCRVGLWKGGSPSFHPMASGGLRRQELVRRAPETARLGSGDDGPFTVGYGREATRTVDYFPDRRDYGEWSLGWGSRGRRFKSCRPDQHHRRSEAVSAGSGGGLNHVRAGSKWEPSGSPRAPNSQTCQRCPIRPSPDPVDLQRRTESLCAVVNQGPPRSPDRFGCSLHREV
jgi:hypothetical protein